jgi:hypothetical protein
VTGATETYAAGTKQLIEDAQRLGILWTLRPATVNSTSPLKVTFDGDDVPISAVSLVGALAAGTRVMGLLIPPGGNFIIGFNDGSAFTSRTAVPVNYSAIGTVGSTTSATYVNVPGNPSVTLIKRFPASLTNIAYQSSFSLFATVVSAGVGLGVNTNGGSGTDIDLMGFAINPASTHSHVSNNKLLTGLAEGTYVLTLRWKRTASAATLQTDGGDWASILAEEVWAV